METKREKNLNAHVWGGREDFNVEGADAVVCITLKDLGDKTQVGMHVEGAFSGADYLRIYENLNKVFGEKHMRMYMMMKAMSGIVDGIMGEAEDEQSESGSGEAESRNGEAVDCH